MGLEKISRKEFEKMKERALKNPIEQPERFGGYRSYRLVERDGRELVRVNDYMSEADGFPFYTIEFVSE